MILLSRREKKNESSKNCLFFVLENMILSETFVGYTITISF